MPGWTGRADVNTGDVIAATDHNIQIDNEEYLYANSKLLIAETVVGAAVTTVTFASLTAYEFFELEMATYNPTGGAITLKIHINGDTTSANYDTQTICFIAATSYSAHLDETAYWNISNGVVGSGNATIRNTRTAASTFGKPMIVLSDGDTAGGFAQSAYATYQTAGQISSITLTASAASAIGIGSRFRLWGK